MRRPFVGLVLIGAAFAVGCESGSTEGTTTTTRATAETAEPTAVVMAVDLSEADDQCGCGTLIRAVRAAAKKGVRTREIDTRKKDEMEAASKKYRILVQPTVLLVDDADREVRRYEGESKDTLAALTADLERMAKN